MSHTKPTPISSSNPNVAFICEIKHSSWIFDCGATDTMTYESFDLLSISHTPCTNIQTRNGDCVDVTRASSVDVSSSINLKICLLIPSLTNKLPFVS